MTTNKTFAERNRTMQDSFERTVFDSLKHIKAGSVVTVKGTATEDVEAVVLNTGFGFNPKKGSQAEVFLVAVGSDTGLKHALMSIQRDKQHQWEEGTGGVQNPEDPEKRLQFDGDGAWLKEGTIRIGPNGEGKITVSGGSLTIEFGGTVDFKCDKLTHNGVNIGDDHVHSQGSDSDGDNEVDTDGPH